MKIKKLLGLIGITFLSFNFIPAKTSLAKENINNVKQTFEFNRNKKGQVINVSTYLRVRKAPNTSSDIISYLHNCENFIINKKINSWCYITFNGVNGYIHEDFVKILNDDSTQEEVTKSGTVINISSFLNVKCTYGT